MNAWSRSEAARTIEEAKRRSAIDPEFRALALSNPAAALAKINPRPIPEGSVCFVELGSVVLESSDTAVIVAVLPEPISAAEEELSDEDLENAAGGSSGPPLGIS